MLSGIENGGHHRPEQTPDDQTRPRVLTLICNVLERLVTRNEQLVHGQANHPLMNGSLRHNGGRRLKGFEGVREPSISIQNYLERIYKYSNCSPSCFVVGFVYIDRLVHKFPDSLVVSLNVHRLLVTSVMLASKMLDDVHCNNAIYARVGGVSNAELNRLELELLFLLDFRVVVSSQVFEIYCQYLEKEMLRNRENHMVGAAITNTCNDDDATSEDAKNVPM